MNLRRVFSIAQKEIRELRRDRNSLRLFLVAPVVQLIMFGYAVSTDLKGVSLGVVSEDPTPEARRLVQAIAQTRAFEMARNSARPSDLEHWLERGDIQIGVHIPPGFGRAISRGAAPAIQVLSDGSDSNTATLAFEYLSGAATASMSRVRLDWRRVHGPAVLERRPQIRPEFRFWFNPALKSVLYQIPGVLGLLLLVLVLSQTSLMIVKERELGTLEQLSVTPIRGTELLLGKSIPVFGIGMLMTLAISLVAVFWFKVPLRGSVTFLAAASALYILNNLGLGLLVSVVSRTQLQAQITANFISTPLILMSGFLFPIANMPFWAQCLTYAMPTRYYMIVVRGVFLKGQGVVELWPEAGALAVLGVLSYAAGVLSFRKRAD
jgi:ABC-2 type transport system permease protein